ncbi:MAG: hypothetical protein WBP93_10405 [Pyrinomonadaceae bacterium]
MYEEIMSIKTPHADEVPVLVTTGRNAEDLHAFTRRLFRFVESRYGAAKRPRHVASGYLTHSGIFVALERFQLTALPSLNGIGKIPSNERPRFARKAISQFGGSLDPFDTLMQSVSSTRPMSTFLRSYQSKHFKDTNHPPRFRSVIIGIPIPSLVAYHLDHIEVAARYIDDITEDKIEELRVAFRRAFRDDLNEIKTSLAEIVLVAHTTAVGGMYDEDLSNGTPVRTIRLGFAHSAQDNRLITKQHEAEEFAKEYAEIGIKMLVTAAAVGIDEVRIRSKIPLHFQIAQKLHETPDELFPGAKASLPKDAKASIEAGHPVPLKHIIRVYKPLTIPLDSPSKSPVKFTRGEPLCPSYSIRSGENGFLSVANADALYRVMRVASASELGHVLATVGLFGDDPVCPWFKDNVCYYTETDNSRQVFDLLNQPPLLQTQMSGLEPLALQELGSAKHQGELHILSLLILLHRLRTLDTDAIDPYVDPDYFDASRFFIEHSRTLKFEDLENWHIDTLSREMQILASAETSQDLFELIPNRHHGGLFPLKDKALSQVLERVLRGVWMIPSLGSPLIFERDGTTFIRTGYYAAPLDLLVTEQDSISAWLQRSYEEYLKTGGDVSKNLCKFEEFRDYHICISGFVDLRPLATLCTAKQPDSSLKGNLKRLLCEEELRAELLRVEPYSFFTTSGLVALMFRLRGLHNHLLEAMAELGTLHEFRWQIPRDSNGHILLVPGAVEAFRMVAEGLEKSTGTERLDGIWGYERRPVPERWNNIPGINPE